LAKCLEEIQLLKDRLQDENLVLREQIDQALMFEEIVGASPALRAVLSRVSKVAPTDSTVLLTGETGTGKETVARAIHADGPFRDRPFLLVDCASPAPGALENELFGPTKTAAKTREGLFTLASGGSVFFDEIGEMPLDIQGRLIRALQDREFHPQSNTKAVPVDVRIIASTSRDLEMAVQQGTFRRDLFFRLNVVSLKLPPLRDRKEDIRPLAEHFLERIGKTKQVQYSVNPEAMKLLQLYDWPGNVRELENCLERAVAMSPSPVLQPADFPPHIRTVALRALAPNKQNRILPLAELEKQAILEALQQLNGDKLMTARALGIGKTTLYRKLKEYGITHWVSMPSPSPSILK